MTEQWRELKETVTEMRDNDGTDTQQDVCKFLVNYMEILEKQIQEPILDKIRAEIEQNAYPIVHGVNNHEKGMMLYGILQIIDKYKAEREE